MLFLPAEGGGTCPLPYAHEGQCMHWNSHACTPMLVNVTVIAFWVSIWSSLPLCFYFTDDPAHPNYRVWNSLIFLPWTMFPHTRVSWQKQLALLTVRCLRRFLLVCFWFFQERALCVTTAVLFIRSSTCILTENIIVQATVFVSSCQQGPIQNSFPNSLREVHGYEWEVWSDGAPARSTNTVFVVMTVPNIGFRFFLFFFVLHTSAHIRQTERKHKNELEKTLNSANRCACFYVRTKAILAESCVWSYWWRYVLSG